MAVYFPYKKKPFSLMGGYLGDHRPGGNQIEIPHFPPPGQRTRAPAAIQVPSRSAAARAIHHGQEMGPNYGTSGNAAINTAMAVGGAEPSGGNVFANLLNRPESDTDFWDKLKEQLAEAGKDYDAADQPFKSLSPVSVPGARHQPAQMPSMLTTRGIPTGGSYNPYLGDPAKRKRVR